MWKLASKAVISGVVLVAAVQASDAQTVGQTPAVRSPGSQTPLGDLSAYRAIAVDTLKIVDTGDFGAAKRRIKDLEVAWDQAEPKMKPLAPEKWQAVDAAIDRALREVRHWRAKQTDSREALEVLIATIDSLK